MQECINSSLSVRLNRLCGLYVAFFVIFRVVIERVTIALADTPNFLRHTREERDGGEGQLRVRRLL